MPQIKSYSDIVLLMGITALYVVFGKLGLLLATINHNSSPIWPASGFAIYALVRYGRSQSLAIFLGALITNYIVGTPFHVSIIIALGNMSEAIVGQAIYRKFGNQSDENTGAHSMPLLLFGMALAGSMVSATTGNLGLAIFSIIPWSTYFTSWYTWFCGDALGILVVVPALLSFSKKIKSIDLSDKFKAGIFSTGGAALINVGITLTLCWLVFYVWQEYASFLLFFVYGLVLISLDRVEQAYLSSLIIYVIAAVATFAGHGPFHSTDPNFSLIYCQVFSLALVYL